MSILKAMFTRNSWLWFHLIGGAVMAKVALIWCVPQVAFIITFAIAICWELIEYGTANVKQEYGSQKRFFGDAIGDIVGACAMALIVVWEL